jgi:hypothetical protein
MSTNEKLTHWENVLKKYFKYIPSEKFWILNVTNKVSKWLNANLSTNNGGSRV